MLQQHHYYYYITFSLLFTYYSTYVYIHILLSPLIKTIALQPYFYYYYIILIICLRYPALTTATATATLSFYCLFSFHLRSSLNISKWVLTILDLITLSFHNNNLYIVRSPPSHPSPISSISPSVLILLRLQAIAIQFSHKIVQPILFSLYHSLHSIASNNHLTVLPIRVTNINICSGGNSASRPLL
jgi:hypothetical protein